MRPRRIFLSSVQKEFARERAAVADWLRGDPLMRRFFEVFLFEEVPAADRRPEDLYLDEVERCDVYVGLLGNDYGTEDSGGVSPTEREFDRATETGSHRMIFVKVADENARHPKMQALIGRAEAGLVRKRFRTPEELVAGLYAALGEYLERAGLLLSGPFEAAPCEGATLDDLDLDLMARFLRTARLARDLPLPEDTPPDTLLKHLNLLNDGLMTNAAVLLFGNRPRRFLPSADIGCAHFHGRIVRKPVPSLHRYDGHVFALVDQAVDFVLGKLNRWVGTRAESVQVPVRYEIPPEVITEAVVNAVAHRDYTSTATVQIMLFSDRLEVWNPGRLPPSLTLEKLRLPHPSVPANPLLAESLYLGKYIEKKGTGTLDMIRRCVGAGLPEPEFSVPHGFVTTIQRPSREEWMAAASDLAPVWTRTPTLGGTGENREETGEDHGEETREETGEDREETRSKTAGDARGTASGTAERILSLLSARPTMTTAALAERIGITRKGVEWQILRLKRAGRLERTGPRKGGRWRVLHDHDG